MGIRIKPPVFELQKEGKPMTSKMARYVFVFLVLATVAAETLYIVRLRDVVNGLIDLNHDKSLYIDGGCPGTFQGSEERLSTEAQ